MTTIENDDYGSVMTSVGSLVEKHGKLMVLLALVRQVVRPRHGRQKPGLPFAMNDHLMRDIGLGEPDDHV
jgi:uncharacterized protein YjiS (DUF1127 family)